MPDETLHHLERELRVLRDEHKRVQAQFKQSQLSEDRKLELLHTIKNINVQKLAVVRQLEGRV